MVEITFKSKNKEKLTALSYILCESFVGWDAFVDNTVVVSNPYECEGCDAKDTYYTMSAVIGPDNGRDSAIMIDIDDLGDEQLQIRSKSATAIRLCKKGGINAESYD